MPVFLTDQWVRLYLAAPCSGPQLPNKSNMKVCRMPKFPKSPRNDVWKPIVQGVNIYSLMANHSTGGDEVIACIGPVAWPGSSKLGFGLVPI